MPYIQAPDGARLYHDHVEVGTGSVVIFVHELAAEPS
jgi:hypothetical protein